MKKINGHNLIELADYAGGYGDLCLNARLINAACERFFQSRGMTHDFMGTRRDGTSRRQPKNSSLVTGHLSLP